MSHILPGSPSIPWSSLENCMDRKAVIIQENNLRKQVGFTTEQITNEVYESKKMLKRIQTLQSDILGYMRATSIVSRDTFKPYKHEVLTKDFLKKVEYFDTYIRLIEGDTCKNINIENQVFENHSVEMVIRMLPLHPGYSTKLFTFHAGKEQVISVGIRVVSKEFVKYGGTELAESWKVEVNYSDNIQFYWISINNNELLRQENMLSPNTKMIFERK